MVRTEDMKMKKIIAVVIIILMLLFCGCEKQDSELEVFSVLETSSDRFVVEYNENYGLGGIAIIRDTETGCAYLFVKNGYGGGLTKLEEVEK